MSNAIASLDRRPNVCVDPFGGSGTTALTCQFLGISPVTIEVNPFLADLIEAKLSSYDVREVVRDYATVVKNARESVPRNLMLLTGAPVTFVEPGLNDRWIFDKKIAARVLSYRIAIDGIKNDANKRLPRVLLGSIAVKHSNVVISGKGRRYRSGWEDTTPSTLRRVEIHSNNIFVQLDRVMALASWRGVNTDGANACDREVVDQRRKLLGSGESLTDDGERLTLSLPVRARFRGGRAAVLQGQDGANLEPRLDMALVKALARAHRWCRMLLDGEVASIEALAARVGQDRGHVGLTLNLAFLSPSLTRTILSGKQPPGLRLSHILYAGIPLSWNAQAAWLDRSANGGAV